MTNIKYLILILSTCSLCGLSLLAHAGPMDIPLLPHENISTSNAAQDYYRSLRINLDKVLQKKIKKRLKDEIFGQDVLPLIPQPKRPNTALQPGV